MTIIFCYRIIQKLFHLVGTLRRPTVFRYRRFSGQYAVSYPAWSAVAAIGPAAAPRGTWTRGAPERRGTSQNRPLGEKISLWVQVKAQSVAQKSLFLSIGYLNVQNVFEVRKYISAKCMFQLHSMTKMQMSVMRCVFQTPL